MIPSGATTPAQSGTWSDGNEEVVCIPQRLFSVISRILIRGSHSSAVMQLVYSTAPAD